MALIAACGDGSAGDASSADDTRPSEAPATTSENQEEQPSPPGDVVPTNWTGPELCEVFPAATAEDLLGVPVEQEETEVLTSGEDFNDDGTPEPQSGCYWYGDAIPAPGQPEDSGGQVPGASLSIEPGSLSDLVDETDVIQVIRDNCQTDYMLPQEEDITVGGRSALHLWCEGRDETNEPYFGLNMVLVDMGGARLVADVDGPAGLIRSDPQDLVAATEAALGRLG